MRALKHGLEKALEYSSYLGAEEFLLLCWLHTQELNDDRKGPANANSKSKTSKTSQPSQGQKAELLLSRARFYSNEQEHEEEPAVSGYCTQTTTNTETRGKNKKWNNKVLLKATKHTAPASSASPVPGPKAFIF